MFSSHEWTHPVGRHICEGTTMSTSTNLVYFFLLLFFRNILWELHQWFLQSELYFFLPLSLSLIILFLLLSCVVFILFFPCFYFSSNFFRHIGAYISRSLGRYIILWYFSHFLSIFLDHPACVFTIVLWLYLVHYHLYPLFVVEAQGTSLAFDGGSLFHWLNNTWQLYVGVCWSIFWTMLIIVYPSSVDEHFQYQHRICGALSISIFFLKPIENHNI